MGFKIFGQIRIVLGLEKDRGLCECKMSQYVLKLAECCCKLSDDGSQKDVCVGVTRTLLICDTEYRYSVSTNEKLNTKRPMFVFFLAPTKPLQSSGQAGKLAPAIQCLLRVERRQVEAKQCHGGWGKDYRKHNSLARLVSTVHTGSYQPSPPPPNGKYKYDITFTSL